MQRPSRPAHPPRRHGGPELEEGVELVHEVADVAVVGDGQAQQALARVEHLRVLVRLRRAAGQCKGKGQGG